ncbi:hypothetical protein OB920_13125 [Halobacteria archaeon HArc-gm2]|nr:hypothetical protein [Halobacteria archaeon HArc-gm2]
MFGIDIDIDVESALMGMGFGLAGSDILMNSVFAGSSILIAGIGVAAAGWGIKFMRNSEPGKN